MNKVLILDNSVEHNEYDPVGHWSVHLKSPFDSFHIPTGQYPKDITPYSHIILTGSVTSILDDLDWTLEEIKIIKSAAAMGKVILGSCYGHQLIARALFGKGCVRRAKGPEIGWLKIDVLKNDGIFLGAGDSIYTFVSHFDEVCNLPKDKAEVIASTKECGVHAFKVTGKPIWGIQAHPEVGVDDAWKLIKSRAGMVSPRQKYFQAALELKPKDSGFINILMKNFQNSEPNHEQYKQLRLILTSNHNNSNGLAMSSDNLNHIALELDQKGAPYAWATVTNVKGSAPRHMGAKMIITADKTFGTIGGGALENAVIEDARSQLRLRAPKTYNYPLGPLLGQCCGGEVGVFIEPVAPAKKVVVFGAGHIAEKLIPMLKELNFNVTLVDERSERMGLPAFAVVDKKINELPSDAFKEIEFSNDLYLIILTHAHIHDEEIVRYCLDKPFKYLGLIGSRNKWEKFKARYKSNGFTEEQLGRVTTPIGLDIKSETPFEIAVSIVAELISLCHTYAV